MGNQCMGGPGRPPSAMQLCQAYDRGGAAVSSSPRRPPGTGATSSRSPSPQAAAGAGPRSIWQYVAPHEVDIVGEIVKAWSRGSMDGLTARRHLQLRVLRHLAPPAGPAEGAGPGAAGAAGGAFASGWASEGSGHGRSPADAGAASSLPMLEAWPALADGDRLLGTLAPWVLGHGQRRHPLERLNSHHQVYALVDAVFGARLFEDARGFAARSLGLDGGCALPEEVRASFREQVDGIMRGSPLHEDLPPLSVRLDLVRVFVCVEVVRHVARSSARSAPLQPRRSPEQLSGVFVIGDGRGPGAGVMLIGVSGPLGSLGALGAQQTFAGLAGTRLEPGMLQDRIGMLLQALMAADGLQLGRPAGLSPEEIDEHCPLAPRPAGDENDCPVCLEAALPGEEIRGLPCGHALHRECCEAWLRTADTCPMCRFKVTQRLIN